MPGEEGAPTGPRGCQAPPAHPPLLAFHPDPQSPGLGLRSPRCWADACSGYSLQGLLSISPCHMLPCHLSQVGKLAQDPSHLDCVPQSQPRQGLLASTWNTYTWEMQSAPYWLAPTLASASRPVDGTAGPASQEVCPHSLYRDWLG